MCYELLDYDNFGFENDFSHQGIIEYYNGSWTDWELIHWFELCMTYLQEKIRKLLDEPIDSWNNKLIGSLNFYVNNKTIKHLVDYLYKQFKKLK